MTDLFAALHAADMAVLDALGADPGMSKAQMVGVAVKAAAPLIREDVLDALEDVVNQACSVADDEEGGSHLDSMALSAYAHGLRVLADHGRVVVEHEVGRRVIGRWV